MAEPLYRFKFFDPLRKRWITARYRATRGTIASRPEKTEIIGEAWTPPNVGKTGDFMPSTIPTDKPES